MAPPDFLLALRRTPDAALLRWARARRTVLSVWEADARVEVVTAEQAERGDPMKPPPHEPPVCDWCDSAAPLQFINEVIMASYVTECWYCYTCSKSKTVYVADAEDPRIQEFRRQRGMVTREI